MNIDQMTVGEFKELSKLMQPKARTKQVPFKAGDKVFIRTVTLYYTGLIKEIVGDWIVLEQASWIADTGRFFDFLKDGTCNEYESFQKPVSIPTGSVIDITEWSHKLFTGNK